MASYPRSRHPAVVHETYTNRGQARSRQQSEKSLQCSVAAYLRMMLPPEIFWTAIPAGGGGRKRGGILKNMGYRAGTPDLLFIKDKIAYWIELKIDNNTLSEAQQKTCLDIGMAGCPNVVVCRSLQDVIDTLRQWKFPARFRRAA
jgi:hypothetical protein